MATPTLRHGRISRVICYFVRMFVRGPSAWPPYQCEDEAVRESDSPDVESPGECGPDLRPEVHREVGPADAVREGPHGVCRRPDDPAHRTE